jgi:hypothetical protein
MVGGRGDWVLVRIGDATVSDVLAWRGIGVGKGRGLCFKQRDGGVFLFGIVDGFAQKFSFRCGWGRIRDIGRLVIGGRGRIGRGARGPSEVSGPVIEGIGRGRGR